MRARSGLLGPALLTVLSATGLIVPSKADSPLAYLDNHTNQYTQELIDLVNIPSISSLPGVIETSFLSMDRDTLRTKSARFTLINQIPCSEHHEDILSAARWLESRLKTAGLEVRLPCASP